MATSLRGYTVFEVMVVLAVTSVIFISAVTVFSGRQEKTQFSQAMYDLQSRIQSYATEVSSGTYPSTTDYRCQAHNFGAGAGRASYWRPRLVSGSQTQSTSQDCIFIGKVIHVVKYPGLHSGADRSNKLYIYNVFGLRKFHADGCATPTNDVATSVRQACPEPAVNDARTNYVLMETYTPLDGMRILSARYSSYPGDADALLFYTSFQDASAASQGMTAYTIGGNVNGDFSYLAPGAGNAVEPDFLDCIEMQYPVAGLGTANCNTPHLVAAAGWRLCIEDAGTNRKAELTINGVSTGIATKLNMASSCT